jgi:hypothetical protein
LPFVAWRRAEIAAARGDEAVRRRLLREAHASFRQRGATGYAERLEKELPAE